MARSRRVDDAELTAPLLPYREAIDRFVASVEPLPPVVVDADLALGCVLAADVVAVDDVPVADNSAMDGYAVDATSARRGDVLTVADVPGPGAAALVMTGNAIPEGADAVVPWEATTRVDGGVRLDDDVDSGRFVRPRGEDLLAGDVAVAAGTLVGPVARGLLAMAGHDRVEVVPRPRVGVVATGDELVDVTEPVGPGRVRDSNGPMIEALARAAGAEVAGRRRVADDPDRILDALRSAADGADLVVTSGGASVGQRDWLRAVLTEHGSLELWKVAMRPGKPVALGRLDGTPVLVLPGNPGSVLACSHVFMARLVRRLAGRDPEPPTVTASLSLAMSGDDHRTVVHPVTLRGDVAEPVPVRSSQVLSTALAADGWVVVPPGGLGPDHEVHVELTS